MSSSYLEGGRSRQNGVHAANEYLRKGRIGLNGRVGRSGQKLNGPHDMLLLSA